MATPAPKSGPGNLATFNILHGFPEALVRGMRSSFLADADYHHLTQCETLDDVRLNLSETDYMDALADMGTLIPTGLQKAAVEKREDKRLNAFIFRGEAMIIMGARNNDSVSIIR
eukprot:scaffold10775_cov119-Skeletonema_dohrnii-CCMP3373.AAC.3